MSNDASKDWEKEYNASFTKKIPFSYIQYDSMRLNPAIEGILYTFSTVNINRNLKFELYTQNGTYNELTAIIKELKDKRAAEEVAKPKEEEKKEENKEEEKKEEPAPQPINYGYYGYGSQPQPPKKSSGDLTEKAFNILAERRRNQRKEQIEEQKKKEEEERKKLEEERKKREEEEKKKKEEIEKKDGGKEEEKKDEEEGKEDEEEKKENFEEATEENESLYKVETEETFQQDMKNCRHFFLIFNKF